MEGEVLEQPDWLVAARRRPRFRGVLHQYAFFAALVVGALLVAFAEGGIARISAIVFAASVAVMLGVSALYHRIVWPPGPRRWIRRLDHAAIFLLIAGTYTPFGLVALDGAWRVGVVALPQILDSVGVAPLTLIAIGGAFYTAGAIIYALKRPDPVPSVFGYHEIFHALVVAAAACQYVGVALFVT